MKKFKWEALLFAGLGVFALLIANITRADDTTPAPTPTANGGATLTLNTDRSLYDKLNDVLAFRYWGAFRGGSLDNVTDSYQPQINGIDDPTSPTSLESLVTVGYKVDQNWIVGMWEHFYYDVASFQDNGNTISSGFLQANPSLMVSRANVIDSNGIHLKLIFSVMLPLTHNAQDYITETIARTGQNRNMLTVFGPTWVFSWDVPKTRLNLGLYGYYAQYLAGPSTPDGQRTYKIYLAPNASYALFWNLSATMWVDLVQAVRSSNAPLIGGMNNPPADIEPGINWDITPNWSVNPVLNIYPNNPTIAATSIQMYINGRVF